jgi:hypothetical protein
VDCLGREENAGKFRAHLLSILPNEDGVSVLLAGACIERGENLWIFLKSGAEGGFLRRFR